MIYMIETKTYSKKLNTMDPEFTIANEKIGIMHEPIVMAKLAQIIVAFKIAIEMVTCN